MKSNLYFCEIWQECTILSHVNARNKVRYNGWILSSLSRNPTLQQQKISFYLKTMINAYKKKDNSAGVVLTLDFTVSDMIVQQAEERNEAIYFRNLIRSHKNNSDCEMSPSDESYVDPLEYEKMMFDEPNGYDSYGRPYGINKNNGSVVPLRVFPMRIDLAGKEVSTYEECEEMKHIIDKEVFLNTHPEYDVS